MKKFPIQCLQLLALPMLFGSAATAATVVNIEAKVSFIGNYSGQGAYSDPGHNYWNAFTTTAGGTNLTASDGVTPTTISFSVGGIPSGQVGFGGGAYGNLLADYYYLYGTTPATFTIGGLTAAHDYDFYIYSQPGSSGVTDRAATITLGSDSKSLSALSVSSFIEDTNYVVFHVTSIGGTSLSGSFVGSMGGNEAELNGLQIVDLGATAVPEPSTCAAVAGLTLLGFAAVRRRRRAGR
jgi:hypothetical protein